MRRQNLPTFDDSPRDAHIAAVNRLNVFVTVAAATFIYALAAINLLGPPACSTQALTPECASALWDGFNGR